jgi:hypothetical protein
VTDHSIETIKAKSASGPGALDGWEAVCSCGFSMGTSLSAVEAARLGSDHVRYMERKEAGR